MIFYATHWEQQVEAVTKTGKTGLEIGSKTVLTG
jgi:hypothetical protein